MLSALCLVAVSAQSEIFVAVNGSDSNQGTSIRPVRSLSRAVKLARKAQSHFITIRKGEHQIVETVQLNNQDSGLTIRAEKGSRPILTGCVKIPIELVVPCTSAAILDRIIEKPSRAQVKQIDLSQLLKTSLAPTAPYGFTVPISAGPNELFADQAPMTVSRWPNSGFTKIGKVIEPGNGEKERAMPPRKPMFGGATDRAKLWTKASDLWLFGYWKFDWADESMKVDSIEAASGQITLAKPHSYGVQNGAEFFAENLIEELDQPGEYFIDRKTSIIYLIPLQATRNLRLTVLDKPIISIKGASNVTIQGLDVAFSRGDTLQILDSLHVTVSGCQIYNLGERGATIEAGYKNGIKGCNIWNTGEGGVALGGGDRRNLLPSYNYVENCDIHHFQRRTQTYRPAVNITGVGNQVTQCSIHDSPHSAIIFSGNDHKIDYNKFYRTLGKTGDGGVVYTGRDWTSRGTEINYNHFYDNVGMSKWEPAIYFDDLASGLRATGNLIERCHWGFLIGGGRDNILTDNVIVDCKLGFDCDARGLGWAASSKPTMMERLNAVPYRDDLWSGRYPGLYSILDNQPMAPMGNVMKRNFLIRSGKLFDRTEEAYKKTALYLGNVEINDKGSWQSLSGTLKFSLDQVGVRKDAVRKTLP